MSASLVFSEQQTDLLNFLMSTPIVEKTSLPFVTLDVCGFIFGQMDVLVQGNFASILFGLEDLLFKDLQSKFSVSCCPSHKSRHSQRASTLIENTCSVETRKKVFSTCFWGVFQRGLELKVDCTDLPSKATPEKKCVAFCLLHKSASCEADRVTKVADCFWLFMHNELLIPVPLSLPQGTTETRKAARKKAFCNMTEPLTCYKKAITFFLNYVKCSYLICERETEWVLLATLLCCAEKLTGKKSCRCNWKVIT